MPKFRKKPVVIEALQFDGSILSGLEVAVWAHQGLPDIANSIIRCGDWPGVITIRTLEGEMQAVKGDWIIKGVAGEFYPCKPEIFEATYEPEALRDHPTRSTWERGEGD
jgi:hypothetical protein